MIKQGIVVRIKTRILKLASKIQFSKSLYWGHWILLINFLNSKSQNENLFTFRGIDKDPTFYTTDEQWEQLYEERQLLYRELSTVECDCQILSHIISENNARINRLTSKMNIYSATLVGAATIIVTILITIVTADTLSKIKTVLFNWAFNIENLGILLLFLVSFYYLVGLILCFFSYMKVKKFTGINYNGLVSEPNRHFAYYWALSMDLVNTYKYMSLVGTYVRSLEYQLKWFIIFWVIASISFGIMYLI